MPADVDTVCAYLQKVKSCSNSAHAVVMHAASISAHHNLERFRSPTKEVCVQAFIKGCKRLLGKPVVSKHPITKDILRDIISQCTRSDVRKAKGSFSRPLNLWRQAIFECAAFLGMCRFSDLVNLKFSDIQITPNFVKLNFFTRKNDQQHKGHSVKLFYSGSNNCPVLLFSKYHERLSQALGKKYP